MDDVYVFLRSAGILRQNINIKAAQYPVAPVGLVMNDATMRDQGVDDV